MAGNIPLSLALRIVARSTRNLIIGAPLCIALEVTHNCTANCRHCDKGALVDDHAVGPDEYGRICREISPSVIQIAGGEPLKRNDIIDIVKAIYRPNRTPLLAIVTNASLLTEDKYHDLRGAGVRQFSISLDFPDNRHDDFRRIPGLFKHIDALIPRLLSHGRGDVVLNTCITRANYETLPDIARLVSSWGAKLNFSAYTDLRTGNHEYNLRHPVDTERFGQVVEELFSGKPGYDRIMTSRRVLERIRKFYENGCQIPNCRTGYRFLVINPDGRLTPCAMFSEERYNTRRELIENFTQKSHCGGCYIANRANTEKSAWELLTDNLKVIRLSRKSARLA